MGRKSICRKAGENLEEAVFRLLVFRLSLLTLRRKRRPILAKL